VSPDPNDRPWRLTDLTFVPAGNGRERATINGVEVACGPQYLRSATCVTRSRGPSGMLGTMRCLRVKVKENEVGIVSC
jgi:hypothetical protein